MKKIYRRIGLLILATILIVGCSSVNQETNQMEESMKGNEAIEEPKNLNASKEKEEAGKAENANEEREAEKTEEHGESERDEKTEENGESGKAEEREESAKLDKAEDTAKEPGPQVRSKVLKDILSINAYTIKINMYSNDDDFGWSVTTIVSNGNTVTTMFLVDSIFKTIEIEDKSYAIMEDTKVIIVSDRYREGEIENPSSDIIYNDLVYIGEGRDVFLGNQRNFEEYKTEKGKIRYYFHENQLDGMELFLDREGQLEGENININQANTIMDVEFFTEEVDMKEFELPEGYKIVEEYE